MFARNAPARGDDEAAFGLARLDAAPASGLRPIAGPQRAPCYTPRSVAPLAADFLRQTHLDHDAARGTSRPLPDRQGIPVNVLDEIVKDQLRSDIPELAPGDTVKVAAKVVEGNRERIQVFEGTVIRLTGGGITRSVTVRRIASGVGVERTFKVNSPRIERIEVVRHGVARRAKLYFLRKRVGKAATLRERRPS